MKGFESQLNEVAFWVDKDAIEVCCCVLFAVQ